MIQKRPATLDDLYRVPDGIKAEIVHGEIKEMAATGGLPGYAGDEIYVSLRDYARRTRSGHAFGDNKGFIVDLPHRTSFSPDAAFHVGPVNMSFLSGAPRFAVEVRSDHDYGPAAEREIAEKRADYFAAGTLAAWDVDVYGPEVVKLYLASAPLEPLVFRRGEMAHAEPVLPGWAMPVDDLFLGQDDD